MNEQLYQTLFVLGPPYPGPPPRAPHLPLDNTKVHPSDINMVYKKPNAVNENTNPGVRDSQLPFAQDYPTDRNDLNLNTHHDKSTSAHNHIQRHIVLRRHDECIDVQMPLTCLFRIYNKFISENNCGSGNAGNQTFFSGKSGNQVNSWKIVPVIPRIGPPYPPQVTAA